MAGLLQSHRSKSPIGKGVLLLVISILWVDTVNAQASSKPTPATTSYATTLTDIQTLATTTPSTAMPATTKPTTTTQATTTTATTTPATTTQTATTQTTTTPATTTPATTTTATTTQTATTQTTTTQTTTTPAAAGKNPTTKPSTSNETNGEESSQDQKKTDDTKSMAVAGLCVVIIVLLLFAINGCIFFRSKLGSCSSRTGVFQVLQMSAIKKDRANETDAEACVEDNKEDADVANKTGSSTSLTKESPDYQTLKENGEVHVKVHVADIAGPSAGIADDGKSKTSIENDDDKDVAPAAAVVDEKKQPEVDPEDEETVVTVTVEGGIENQEEQP